MIVRFKLNGVGLIFILIILSMFTPGRSAWLFLQNHKAV